MQRPIEGVAASQEKLRQRLAGKSAADAAAMVERLAAHRDRIIELLRQAPNVDLLEVSYSELLENPWAQLERIADFSRMDRNKTELMAAVIDPRLCHFRRAPVDQITAES
jgi:hypothetical protein